MKPGARIQAAIDLLTILEAGEVDATQAIDDYFRRRRYAGSGDRRAITAQVYDLLRLQGRLDWWIERTGTRARSDPRRRIQAHLLLSEHTSPADLETLFSGGRYAPAPLDDAERALAEALYGRPLTHADMPAHVRLAFPGWMESALHAVWGERLETEMAALNQIAPVDVRVNQALATREEAEGRLRAEDIATEPTPLSPYGLRIEGRPRLGGTWAYQQGWIEVQDEGSQLAAFLTGARPGMTVIDYCAGAGGKTLALAAAMTEDGSLQGRLIACDVSRYRLDRMTPRLTRARVTGVTRKVIAAAQDSWVAANRGMADRVLVDAPCTRTGAWRREPAERWRFQPDDLDHLIATQASILAQAADLVAPKGRLVYATCSVLKEENEDQMAAFLEAQPAFRPIPAASAWRETIGGEPPPQDTEEGLGLRLSPASSGTDGFYVAVLEKIT